MKTLLIICIICTLVYLGLGTQVVHFIGAVSVKVFSILVSLISTLVHFVLSHVSVK